MSMPQPLYLLFWGGSDIVKKTICFMLVLCTICLLSGCFDNLTQEQKMTKKLDSLLCETDIKPSYVCFDTIYMQDTSLNMEQVCDRYGSGNFEEVFLVEQNRIWFLFTTKQTNGSENWHIATVDDTGNDLQVVYQGNFCFTETADPYYSSTISHKANNYQERNGFYWDGKIVLTDHDKLIEFDVHSKIATEFLYRDYTIPVDEISIQIHNNQEIVFSFAGQKQKLDSTLAASTSPAFKSLMKLESETTWNGKSKLTYLFDQVQIVQGVPYIICRILNKQGETYAAVFVYDKSNNQCAYAFYCYTNDLINSSLYIIPVLD